MRNSVVFSLILKDWRLLREQIVFSMIGGALALVLVQRATETSVVVGAVWFFISIILVGALLPLAGIVNERKNKNLAFLMSLPISSIQYTTSKLLSSTGMFLIPWLALVIAGLVATVGRGIFLPGAIPFILILSMMPFVGLAIITAAALMGETEGWGIAANVAVQSSYGLCYYFLTKVQGVMSHNQSPVLVWSPIALKILGTEVAVIPLLLGITYFVQSRKRDFI